MAVDGKWNITLPTPVGDQAVVMELVTDGGNVSGSMTSDMGVANIPSGTVDGDNVEWIVDMTMPMPMKLEFTATVDGDAIKGDVVMGFAGKSAFEGTRA